MPFRLFFFSFAFCVLAGAASAQERQWTLDASDQDAFLIFGVPESDDLGISLWCPIRQGMVNVFVPETGEAISAGKELIIILKAGEETAEIKGKTEQNLDAGVASAEGQIPADHPVFEAMTKEDRFRVTVGKEEIIFPLMEADVAGLLELCRKE